MGEASRRGTFEERKAAAIERDDEVRERERIHRLRINVLAEDRRKKQGANFAMLVGMMSIDPDEL